MRAKIAVFMLNLSDKIFLQTAPHTHAARAFRWQQTWKLAQLV